MGNETQISENNIEEGGTSWLSIMILLVISSLITVIGFVLVSLFISDMRRSETVNLTRDLASSTQQSIKNIEDAMLKTNNFFWSNQKQLTEKQILNLDRVIFQKNTVDRIIWANSAGRWYAFEPKHKKAYVSYNSLSRLPDDVRLIEKSQAYAYNRVRAVNVDFWKRQQIEDRAHKNIGLVIKNDTSNLESVFFAEIPYDVLFNTNWNKERHDLIDLNVYKQGEDKPVYTHVFKGDGGVSERNSVVATHDIRMGDMNWELHYNVIPSNTLQMLSMLPWVWLVFGIVFTILLALHQYRRLIQMRQMNEISNTLRGTSSALKSSKYEKERLIEALQKSERDHRAMVNSVSEIIFETDERGYILFLNQAWQRVTDLDCDSALRKSIFDYIHPDQRAEQRRFFNEFIGGQKMAYKVPTKLSLGNDRYRHVDLAFSMVRMAEDKSLRVVGTLTDTEQRQAAETALRDAEQKYREIVENSINAIYQTTPGGKIVSANPALAEILGYRNVDDLMECIGDIQSQIYVDPQDRRQFVRDLNSHGKVTGIETKLRRKDGEEIWVLENARVVRDKHGNVKYYEGNMSDITEKRAADEALRNAKLQAELSSKAKMDFLANMSHELRTPLNSIIGFSEVIKNQVMGEIPNKEYIEYASDIYNSGNYLLKIISEILEVSKIETGERQLNETNIPLSRIVNTCLNILNSKITDAEIEFKADLPAELPEVLGEELVLKQIFINLLSNAIKHTPKGGQIFVTAKSDNHDNLVFEITDTGVGMSAEELEQALQPFGQVNTDLDRDTSGTGLGLTIVQSLVALHDAEFKLISQKNIGTTARITFPPNRLLQNYMSGNKTA